VLAKLIEIMVKRKYNKWAELPIIDYSGDISRSGAEKTPPSTVLEYGQSRPHSAPKLIEIRRVLLGHPER